MITTDSISKGEDRRNAKCSEVWRDKVIGQQLQSDHSSMNQQDALNRLVSSIFANSTFRPIFKTGESDCMYDRLRECQTAFYPVGKNVREILVYSYAYLSKNYRNEYVYKNTIANKILLGRHSLNTATLINEFKIGNSIADILLLNGACTIYEIKTELDSPEKLVKQIADYKKAFPRIFLVTHHTLVEKYSALIDGTSVGLISLTSRLNLSLIKDATDDYSQLDNAEIMKCLRKDEYSRIIKKYYGTIPAVCDIKYFSSCLELFKRIDPVVLHSLVLAVLKQRSYAGRELLISDQTPHELKYICLSVNPSKEGYNNLFSFLNRPL